MTSRPIVHGVVLGDVRPCSHVRRLVVVLLAAAAVLTAGGLSLVPLAALGLVAVAGFVAMIAARPAVGAYLLIGLTPLTAGIDRGTLLPLVRPSEALALLVGTGLVARGLPRLRLHVVRRLRPGRVEASILLMAVANSVVPFLGMLVRGRSLSADDVLYALVLWKFLGIYLLLRSSLRGEQEVRRCLWICLAAGSVVGGIAILQSLNLFGVPQLLIHYYAPFGYSGLVSNQRGSSTLALSAAVADLMVFNLAIVAGLWRYVRRRTFPLAVAAAFFVVCTLASGQFSGAIGLAVGVVAIAYVTRSLDLVRLSVPMTVVAATLLHPVVARRLEGFQSASGLPSSWAGRLRSLRSYFWPELFSDGNFLLGVRPAARIWTSQRAAGYVWIESGYTWLIWGGGLPLLASYLYFLWATMTKTREVARQRRDAIGVAALAAFVAVVVTGVLMVVDPHLTYRGSGDTLFALLALGAVGGVGGSASIPDRSASSDILSAGKEKVPDDEVLGDRATATTGLPSPGQSGGDELGRSSLGAALRSQAVWILAVTFAVTATAGLFLWRQSPRFTSSSRVVLEKQVSVDGASSDVPSMATEKQVAMSGVVLSLAASRLQLGTANLADGLVVDVPVDTQVLKISYSSSEPVEARRRAKAVAEAYVQYRNGLIQQGELKQTAPRRATPKALREAVPPKAEIITPATLPDTASSPRYLVDMPVALLVGVSLGLVVALVRDRRNDRLRAPGEFSAQTGLPVLAIVPGVPGGRGGEPVLASAGSPAAEAYRLLRARLLAPVLGREWITVVITGSTESEAKPAVAANLAAILAASGRRVVVVCADGRRRRLQAMFGIGAHEPGLTDVLRGQVPLEQALRETAVDRLRLLPAGRCVDDLGALFELHRFDDLIARLRHTADVVVTEAPPASGSGDGVLIANAGDIVVLAEALGGDAASTCCGVRETVTQLQYVLDRIVGGVVYMALGAQRSTAREHVSAFRARVLQRHPLQRIRPVHPPGPVDTGTRQVGASAPTHLTGDVGE